MSDNISPEQRAGLRAIDELVAANHESNRTMAALVEHVRKETLARDRKIDALDRNQRTLRKLTVLGTVVAVALLVVGFINAFNIAMARRNAAQTATIARDVGETNRTLLDCLNSTGVCGKRNAQNQRKVLDEVKQYELTGFYCIRLNPATEDPNAEAFLKCMQRLYPGGPTLTGR